MILLTGATGFVGHGILKHLLERQSGLVRTYGRRLPTLAANNVSIEHVNGNFDSDASYVEALCSVDVVIHCAAIAHTHKNLMQLKNELDQINCTATINLARQAASNGVKRFIFMSSIGVNGGGSQNKPFRFDDVANPWDMYTESKYNAELALQKLSFETGLEVVIIRPPLIYGANAPGNFGRLSQAVRCGRWLPLGAINNKRSFVALDNLVDLVVTCIDHPKAANQIFLVSDDRDVSTTELLTMMFHTVGKYPHLLPVPMSWLKIVGRVTGKQAVIERLCGNLQVDINHTKEILGWKPPVSMQDAIQRCFDERELHVDKNT